MARKKAVFGIALVLLASCLIGARIWIVNAQAVTVPTEHYQMKDWIDLSGSYFFDLRGEDMQGYSLRINKAEALSYNEYINQYAKERPSSDNGLVTSELKTITTSDDPDQKTILVLEYEIKNEGNDGGGIGLYQQNLIPVRKNVSYKMNNYLWRLAEPQFDGKTGGVSLKKDSTYSMQVPFANTSNPAYFRKFDREILQPNKDDTSFQLTLCNAPVRKIVDVELS